MPTIGGPPVLVTEVTGVIKMWATATAPSGYLLCDGSAVSRTTYTALFAVLGTTYGVGDGSTTFNLPNLKGAVPVGQDTGQTEFTSLGQSGGEKTHLLTSTEMPSHTHTQNSHIHGRGIIQTGAAANNPGSHIGSASATVFYTNGGSGYTADSTGTDATTATNQNTGSGGAHNNLQPYVTLTFIIKS